jgi:hypothetical protein
MCNEFGLLKLKKFVSFFPLYALSQQKRIAPHFAQTFLAKKKYCIFYHRRKRCIWETLLVIKGTKSHSNDLASKPFIHFRPVWCGRAKTHCTAFHTLLFCEGFLYYFFATW